MNIVKVGIGVMRAEQVAKLLKTLAQASSTKVSEWIAIPHEVDIITNVSIEQLRLLKSIVDRRIEELETKEDVE